MARADAGEGLFSRRAFLKGAALAAGAAAGILVTGGGGRGAQQAGEAFDRFASLIEGGSAVPKSNEPEGWLIASGRMYQLPEGKIPVTKVFVADPSADTGKRMVDGKIVDSPPLINEGPKVADMVVDLAKQYSTRPSLIREANGLAKDDQPKPGTFINIPEFALLPWSYIPEAGLIRHELQDGDTKESLGARYGLSPSAVGDSWADTKNVMRTPDGKKVLIIRNAEVPSVGVPVEVIYPEVKDGESLLPKKDTEAIVNRIFRIILHESGGDTSIFEWIKKNGLQVDHGYPGFMPPASSSDHYWVAGMLQDTNGEGEILRALGHEIFHALPFPWWSTGADEGTAGFVASEWTTRQHWEYDPKTGVEPSDEDYDKANVRELRNIDFGMNPAGNRALAVKAWQRIEKKYPGVVGFLLRANCFIYKDSSTEPNGPTSVETIKAWVTAGFGKEAWDFIDSQHILFTR